MNLPYLCPWERRYYAEQKNTEMQETVENCLPTTTYNRKL